MFYNKQKGQLQKKIVYVTTVTLNFYLISIYDPGVFGSSSIAALENNTTSPQGQTNPQGRNHKFVGSDPKRSVSFKLSETTLTLKNYFSYIWYDYRKNCLLNQMKKSQVCFRGSKTMSGYRFIICMIHNVVFYLF